MMRPGGAFEVCAFPFRELCTRNLTCRRCGRKISIFPVAGMRTCRSSTRPTRHARPLHRTPTRPTHPSKNARSLRWRSRARRRSATRLTTYRGRKGPSSRTRDGHYTRYRPAMTTHRHPSSCATSIDRRRTPTITRCWRRYTTRCILRGSSTSSLWLSWPTCFRCTSKVRTAVTGRI